MENLTESKIQKVVSEQFFSPNSVKYMAENLFLYDWESDFWIMMKSGLCYEFEIKISRSDFFNDFKHKQKKHLALQHKYTIDIPEWQTDNEKLKAEIEEKCNRVIPNYFYYAVPKELITVEEIPEYAGLIYVEEDGFLVTKKKAPKLTDYKSTVEELNLADKFYYNYRHWRDKNAKNQILVEEMRSMERKDKVLKEKDKCIKADLAEIERLNKLLNEECRINRRIFLRLREILETNNIDVDYQEIENDAIKAVE